MGLMIAWGSSHPKWTPPPPILCFPSTNTTTVVNDHRYFPISLLFCLSFFPFYSLSFISNVPQCVARFLFPFRPSFSFLGENICSIVGTTGGTRASSTALLPSWPPGPSRTMAAARKSRLLMPITYLNCRCSWPHDELTSLMGDELLSFYTLRKEKKGVKAPISLSLSLSTFRFSLQQLGDDKALTVVELISVYKGGGGEEICMALLLSLSVSALSRKGVSYESAGMLITAHTPGPPTGVILTL